MSYRITFLCWYTIIMQDVYIRGYIFVMLYGQVNSSDGRRVERYILVKKGRLPAVFENVRHTQ